ncbi:hypothetical protein Acr_28g0001180 [Actinidia rufa]|uniref:Uncharacterized protein n=1 Tax=Actinidia rufa TaxID=165716 RepID=A0A7J0H8I2_9ERIC|nr:hypothetical protein Acr_28g0001180 [Actinidia rufa]
MLTMIPEFLSCIGRLQELHRRPWDSVAYYFGFLQSRWKELAQYESLSDFPAAAATIISQRLARQHTYQFLIGLKSEYESLRIQILNTSPLPSLYEAFAIIDRDERCCRLIQTLPTISSGSTPIADQMVFAASGSGSHSSCGKPICSYYGNIGHIRQLCFKLHPELKGTSSKRKGKGPRTATVAETSPGHVLDLSHIQSQLGLLQSQLGSLLQQQPSGSTATLATSTLTAFHAKIGHPTWVLDSEANDHVTGTSSLLSIPTNLDGLPYPIPLFDSPPVQVPLASVARAPLKVYTRHAPPSAPQSMF